MELDGAKDVYIKNGQKFLADLDNFLLRISQALPEQLRLLKELANFRDKQKKRFEKLLSVGDRQEGAAES
jgi:hypothetical protein